MCNFAASEKLSGSGESYESSARQSSEAQPSLPDLFIGTLFSSDRTGFADGQPKVHYN